MALALEYNTLIELVKTLGPLLPFIEESEQLLQMNHQFNRQNILRHTCLRDAFKAVNQEICAL